MTTALPSYEQAAALVAAYALEIRKLRPATERVKLAQAAGRVLAQPLRADRDQPPFTRSTRDGFACRAAEASDHAALNLVGSTHAGDAPSGPLPPDSVWEIMTGAPVPAGADAVVMVEHVDTTKGRVRLLPHRSIKTGENIVAQGAQARGGDLLLEAGTAITYGQIALAAACGYASLEVFARPRVAILATGDELVPVEAEPRPGQIRNSNAPMLAAMVEAAGGEAWVLPAAADTAEALDASLSNAAEADLLLISGGVSAGKFDLVEPALARAGARFHFTGVRIQPGKPLVFGEMPSHSKKAGKAHTLPLFGLPGNPVSSAVTFLLFAAPVLAALAGHADSAPRFALARLAPTADRHGKAGLTRFLPAFCTFGAGGELPEAGFVPWHGSGDLAALARSNSFLVVPEEAHALEPGAIVRILLC
ncbi:MAG: molybdopterin molybdotransferase MoeA [Terracidiphilus sp.]|nr:molybdopterin molybdotransferase MoeA [Terracidiphilus sp.]MDR3776353.1 molybdopterin molybdotransferase MoeA [Terracidiphilus sp.]